ncbi:hypothetical protein ANCCEY_09176 [Ancylostoma ceylanicum]|uniref:Kinesin motor domain-containing protein n=1 Tax=Ancylostoma ceylanicum TaxID=53326 RepID=A0A0D6LNV9_9BILA|nr:hypothetical protein ANCCEY_09176 [Ancylostoma ceylanicum]
MERVLTAPAATAAAAAALKPPPPSPIRTNSKLRLCAIVSRDDVTSGGITVPVANQVHIAGAAKSHSKNAFENVFGPDAAQDRICSNVLPELVQGVFNGQDCTFIALGGKSRGEAIGMHL